MPRHGCAATARKGWFPYKNPLTQAIFFPISRLGIRGGVRFL
jgi:hypothetical protein